jgi:hypothetical protein
MLPLLAHFPMGCTSTPANLALVCWYSQTGNAPRIVVKTNRAQEHEITNTVYKRIHLNREMSIFCTVVDSLTATSLSKAKSPNSIIPVE